MKLSHTLGGAITASLALGLAACGGGGGSGSDAAAAAPAAADVATESVPSTAVSTLDAFLAYQKTLQPADTIEPLTLQQQLPPISDTTEPTPLT